MTFTQTEQQLSQITDEGLFEKLAMAVLRAAEPDYRAMVHTGVNADGKTIKSPVDGILCRTDTDPPRLVVVHHTTTAIGDLRKKWLHDPATVRQRRNGKPTAPMGDVLKAIAIIADERTSNGNLRGTLVLTTNQEPDADTVRDVAEAARHANVDHDIWSRSRLADFLDNNARGQWLRHQYLSIDAELLSRELLLKLSKASAKIHVPRDVPEAWIVRDLDAVLDAATQRETTFLVAQSGFGKSVAGYQWLARHIERGGAGLVLPHGVIGGALTIGDAIDFALRQLCPRLTRSAGTDALALSSAEQPLYLVVEDINRSGQPALLAEHIEGWARAATGNSLNLGRRYRLLCPLWPSVLTSMDEEARKAVSALAVFGSSFTPTEGRRAVERRATLRGRPISDMEADAVSAALGHDPLLIALHDPSKAAASSQVIGDFVEGVVGRVALAQRDYTAADYRASLRAFAGAALQHHSLNPLWSDVRRWPGIDAEDLRRLSHLMHEGKLLHLSGRSVEQQVDYRHDRVREWLLIDAADPLAAAGTLPNAIMAEPYFAEVIGGVVAHGQVGADFVSRVRVENPLALFHALRLLTDSATVMYKQVVTEIKGWLSDPSTHAPSNQHLRLEALAALAQTDAPDVIRLVSLFKEHGWMPWQARLRNGDVSGGIQLCATVEPGVGAPWRDVQIEHAKHKIGCDLVGKLDGLLRRQDLNPPTRAGALRLAGHVADPLLADAIAASWALDSERHQHLADYLWACAECCGTNAEQYLEPVCDAWAALPSSKAPGQASPRDDLAANQVRWAFRKWVPTTAIPYFVKRAESEDLRSPITHMLSEIDDPIAARFIVREMAEMERRIDGTDSFSPFAVTLPGLWRRRQEAGDVGMSEASRGALQTLWTDPSTDKHVRRAAFRLWAATHTPTDLDLLRDPSLPAELADSILHERLLRSDRDATPVLLKKIRESENASGWWHMMRYVWSDNLLSVLDAELERRAEQIAPDWNRGTETDRATSDLLMRLSPETGEALLTRHWAKLQYVSYFVQAALYLATPGLCDLAGEAIAACADPKKLLQYIGQHIGFQLWRHPGITREAQIVALAPYLPHLAHHEVMSLWELCNQSGWFTLRRSHLDPHLRATSDILFEDEAPTFAALDDMAVNTDGFWISRWLERYAKTGATPDMIVARISGWFAQRKTFETLILVHNVLVTIGKRCDLAMLDMALDLDAREPFADAIRADTVFAVKRRTLY
jgi:hypothetical protein